MRQLLKYLRGYTKESILGPLFKLLEASFELIVPLVIAAVIDTGIAREDTGYIIRMCAVLVLLGVVGLACSLTAQYFAAKASAGFVKQIRHALFSHIQRLSYSELDTVGTTTMITRMTSDMNQVQSGVNLTLRLLLRSPFVVFGAMIMAFTIDVKAALLFAAAIPALSIVVFGIMLVCIPLYKKVQQRLDRVLGITKENLTGVRVLRAFCKEDEERRAFREKNSELTAVQKYVGRISALMNPVTYVIINAAVIALIWTGALQVDGGILTQGQVVALYNYMSQILVELIKLASLIISITKAVACGNRIQALFEIEPGMQEESAGLYREETRAGSDAEREQSGGGNRRSRDGGEGESEAGGNMRKASAQSAELRAASGREPRGAEPPAVEFCGASLRYQNAADVSLKEISFSVGRGQTIGVIGGTGSGKTSLVNLIPRFYDVEEGAVRVNGRDVRAYALEELRAKIGVVPQKAVLFKGTIRENMQWGKKDASDEEIMEALTTAQAREIVEAKDRGLDFLVEQGGKNLSGGQKQRLTIARALVRKPDILILDDSASALDFVTDAALRRAIRGMADAPTVFIVSQRAASIRYADQIVVLEDGRIAGIGTHEQLLERCEVYREIYESQFRGEGR